MAMKVSLPRARLRPILSNRSREEFDSLHNNRKSLGRSLCYSPSTTPIANQRRRPVFHTSLPVPWQDHDVPAPNKKRNYSQISLIDRLPPNSWDSHMHVVDPTTYPLSPTAQYTPKPHTLSDATHFYSSLSSGAINSMVFVQPSIYGNDNSCMLDALRTIGPRHGRAVVAFDPKTVSSEMLQEWHAIGVRGVRLNLQSVGKEMGHEELSATLQEYAKVTRPLRWVLQLYVPLKTAVGLEEIVQDLGVRVCLDHFGHPTLPDPEKKELYTTSGDPYTLLGFGSLVNLLRQGSTFVKMSAPYRISKQEGQEDLEPLARELLDVAGKSVVFATDWPHTRFSGLDIRPFVERVLGWCGDDKELVERLFKSNAEDLWDVKT